MKKYAVLMTLVLMLTLALAACGTEANEGGTEMNGGEAQETETSLGTAPAVAATETTPNSPFNTEGTVSPDVTALPDTGLGATTPMATVAATQAATKAPTKMATAAATTSAMPPSPITATVVVTEGASATVDYGAVRVEKLLGYELKNANGDNLGKVEDLVVDLNRACVPYAVVRVDDAVATENELVLVPFSAFTFDQSVAGKDASFVANLDAATLVSAPGFAADQMPDFGLLNWDEMYNGYWLNEGALAGAGSMMGGCKGSASSLDSGAPMTGTLKATPVVTSTTPLATPSAAALSATPSKAAPAATAVTSGSAPTTAYGNVSGNGATPNPQTKGEMMNGVLLASKLVGMNVQDAQGEGLGEVKDVLVEAQTGTVRYVVVGAGGILGLGEKLIPVPLQAFDFQNDKVVVNVDRDYLTNAPNFNLDELMGGASGWDSSLRSYWNAYTWPQP